MNIVARLCE